MENGVAPLDPPTTEFEINRKRAMSVDTITQAGNGSIVELPTLHIPGETGELAGLSSEMYNDRSSPCPAMPNGVIAPEKLKKVYAQVSEVNVY